MILGRRYNRTKKAQNDGGVGTSKATGGQIDPRLPERTSETLAAQYGVSEKTVRRAGADAALLDQHPEVAAAQRKSHTRHFRRVALVSLSLYLFDLDNPSFTNSAMCKMKPASSMPSLPSLKHPRQAIVVLVELIGFRATGPDRSLTMTKLRDVTCPAIASRESELQLST